MTAHRHLPRPARLRRRARRCGLREACTSPGSRSTPLVLSLAREPRLPRDLAHRRALRGLLRARAGQGDAAGRSRSPARPAPRPPTTRPAVIEAHEARVPLLVLTADRPPELRDVGAGQTIDQVKLYGGAAKWFLEVDDARRRRPSACAGCASSPAARSGPRSTAAPAPCTSTSRCASRSCSTSRCRTTSPARRARRRPAVGHAPAARRAGRRGRCSTAARCAARAARGRDRRRPRRARPGARRGARRVRRRARACPLLADPLSGARRGPAAIAHYDALLRDAAFAAAHAPDLVAARRRPADLQAAAQLARGARRRCRSPSTPRARGRTPPASSRRSSPPTRARRSPLRRAPPRAPDPAGSTAGAPPTRRGAARSPRPLGRRARASRAWPPSSAPRCPPRRRSSSPPRCRSATSRRSCPPRDDPPRVLANRGANGIDGTVVDRVRRRRGRARRPGRAAHRRRRARPRPRRPARRARGSALALDDRAARQRRRRHLRLPPGRARRATPSRSTSRRRTGLDFAHAAALYGLGYERAGDVAEASAPRSSGARRRPHDDHRTCAPTAGERRPAPAGVGRVAAAVRAAHSVARDGPDEPPARPRGPPVRPADPARTSKGIGAGRHRRGRPEGPPLPRVVTGVEQLESGRFELALRPLDSRISLPHARTVREVVTVYRRAGSGSPGTCVAQAVAGAAWQGRRPAGIPPGIQGSRTPPGGDQRQPGGVGTRVRGR